MSDVEDDENSLDWSVHDLMNPNICYNKPPPTDSNIKNITTCLFNEWCPNEDDDTEPLHPSAILNWAVKRFTNKPIEDITFDELEKDYKKRIHQLMVLHNFIIQSPMLQDDMEFNEKILTYFPLHQGSV